jgi:hypothetical protein
MPYREKTAWLSLIAIALVFGPYFAIVSMQTPQPPGLPSPSLIGLFAAAAVARMLILGVGYLYLRLRFPEDSRMPPDERDRAISSRSISYAYYVLIAGMILVGVVMPFNSGGWKIINAAIAMIVAAEVVHYGTAVYGYRRQA